MRLIERLHGDGIPIMVPSIALSEYLTGCSEKSREANRAFVEANFFVAPFDAKCSAIAANIWDATAVGEAKAEAKVGKQSIKADIFILATAIAHGATTLWVEDGHFFKFAQDKVIIKGIPALAGPDPGPTPGVPPDSPQRSLYPEEPESE
jgi:predicted nucleic acid-binding protein